MEYVIEFQRCLRGIEPTDRQLAIAAREFEIAWMKYRGENDVSGTMMTQPQSRFASLSCSGELDDTAFDELRISMDDARRKYPSIKDVRVRIYEKRVSV